MNRPSLDRRPFRTAGERREHEVGPADPEAGVLVAEPTDDVPATSGRTERPRQRRHRALALKLGIFVAVAVAAVVLLQAFVVRPYTVPGNAMAPTVQAGDRILVLKWGLLEGPIHRGDIVVFQPPRSLPCTVVGGRGGDLVLRVMALPGEVIQSVGDKILVDGRPLRDRGWYDPGFGEIGSTSIASTRVAPGHYFLMGDNRSDACDSRTFGPIAKSSIVGKGIAVVARGGHLSLGTL